MTTFLKGEYVERVFDGTPGGTMCVCDEHAPPRPCAMIMPNGAICGAVAVGVSSDGYPFCADCATWGL